MLLAMSVIKCPSKFTRQNSNGEWDDFIQIGSTMMCFQLLETREMMTQHVCFLGPSSSEKIKDMCARAKSWSRMDDMICFSAKACIIRTMRQSQMLESQHYSIIISATSCLSTLSRRWELHHSMIAWFFCLCFVGFSFLSSDNLYCHSNFMDLLGWNPYFDICPKGCRFKKIPKELVLDIWNVGRSVCNALHCYVQFGPNGWGGF